MFYIKIERKKRGSEVPRPAGDVQYVAVPEQFAGNAQYYQIYENGKPLSGLSFQDIKQARKRLAGFVDELNVASNGWYRVENRSRYNLTVRNILGVKKVYSDGSYVNVTYVIRKIDIAQRWGASAHGLSSR